MQELEIISDLKSLVGTNLPDLTPSYTIESGHYNGYAVKDRKIIGLTIRNREIKDFPEHIFHLNDLEILNIINCELRNIPENIRNLKQLTHLNLRNNNIKLLPYQLCSLSKIKYLDLRNNQLTKFPQILSEFNLEYVWENSDLKHSINLFGNPFEPPPIEIISKGRIAILEYYKSLKGSKFPVNEIKVLLVGDGGSGKTSLVKRIIFDDFNSNESQTHGINIRDWKINSNGKLITVHFWDFGGQQIMHATHQFFFSKRSIYVLVLDGRKEEDAEYWLKLIESFGGDSPILLVLNKMDQHPSFDVNRKFLNKKYRGIKGFFPTSCSNKKGINLFKESLSSVISNIELLKTTWAKSWLNVKEHLENMTNNFITYDGYKKICQKENIIEQISQDTLVDFLNDLGVILHFKDLRLLDTHVLEPRWVTEAVYKIINSEIVDKSKGLLKLDLLDKILAQKSADDYYYPQDRFIYIINLMIKFEICYELDSRHILLPDLLAIQEPKIKFDYKNAIHFIIVYDFLPKSIMPRFIVKRHKDIANNLCWKTGVVLKDNVFNSIAVIKADERDKKIYIYVNGEQKRQYLSIIRKTFRDINNSFEKLNTHEMVPLLDNFDYSVEYEELVGYEIMGKEEYTVGRLRKTYQVSYLLDGIEKPEERKMHKKSVKHYHFYDGQKVVSTGDFADITYNENLLNENIAVLIEQLKNHNIKEKEELIQILQNPKFVKDKKKLSETIGKVISNSAGISSIISTGMAILENLIPD